MNNYIAIILDKDGITEKEVDARNEYSGIKKVLFAIDKEELEKLKKAGIKF